MAGARAAGCYLIIDQRVALVIDQLGNQIQLPIGARQSGEAPHCTAIRETLEETGVKVKLEGLIERLGNGDVYLYRCRPSSPIAPAASLHARDRVEIAEVVLVDPQHLTLRNGQSLRWSWRFPRDQQLIQRLGHDPPSAALSEAEHEVCAD